MGPNFLIFLGILTCRSSNLLKSQSGQMLNKLLTIGAEIVTRTALIVVESMLQLHAHQLHNFHSWCTIIFVHCLVHYTFCVLHVSPVFVPLACMGPERALVSPHHKHSKMSIPHMQAVFCCNGQVFIQTWRSDHPRLSERNFSSFSQNDFLGGGYPNRSSGQGKVKF